MDDNLLIKEENNPVSIQDIVSLSDEMGVASNHGKVNEFANKQRYIGFIWNVEERTARLPEDKFEERHQQVNKFLVKGMSFTLEEVESLVGRLANTTYIVPTLRCCMPSFYRWQK